MTDNHDSPEQNNNPEEAQLSQPENDSVPTQTTSDEASPTQVFQTINKRWGCAQTCGITLLGLIVIAVLSVLVIGFIGQSTLTNFVGSFGGLFQSGPSSAEIVSGRTLVNSIQPLGQLVTISTELAKSDILVDVESGVINACGHSANHVAEGVIEAGVDFTQITANNISYTEATNTYNITVPYPQITSCRIEYIRQYDTSSNLGCSPNWDEVRVLAQNVAMDGFVEDALGRGILERAERENTLLMQSFVTALTDANVNIQYVDKDIAGNFIPPSCQPELPQGWGFNSSLGKWVKN